MIKIAAADQDVARLRRMGAVVGERVQLPLRLLAGDAEQCVADGMHGGREVSEHPREPRHVRIRGAAEHRPMIIDRVIVIEAAQPGEITAVAGPAVAEHQLVQRLLVDELLQRIPHVLPPPQRKSGR